MYAHVCGFIARTNFSDDAIKEQVVCTIFCKQNICEVRKCER